MTREEEARSKLIAQVTSTPGWVLPEAQAAVSIETAVAFALAFADAEAAAMRERAAGVAEDRMPAVQCMSVEPIVSACTDIATAIRALPATGEVGRG